MREVRDKCKVYGNEATKECENRLALRVLGLTEGIGQECCEIIKNVSVRNLSGEKTFFFLGYTMMARKSYNTHRKVRN